VIDRAAPELVGLVLAGGESRRMRRDKGAIDYHGAPQAEHCHRLLTEFCTRVFISVNLGQSTHDPYCRLPLLIDAGSVAGPAAGLLAAWTAFPEAALLAFAVDLPLVDAALLSRIVERRNPDKAATVWVHPDGVVEPLCAIWEPALRPGLVEAAEAGTVSLRRLLEAADVERLVPPEPERIVSVNTEERYRELTGPIRRD
jgi:molybdenum cofactor guanylyltransferase